MCKKLTIGAFVVGGAVGAAIALLYAPRTGVETRALVSDKVECAWGSAQQLGSNVAGRSQEIYLKAAERGRDALDNIKPVVEEKKGEFQERIEQARKKIAEQVSKNADSAYSAVQEGIPAAAEAAKGVATKAHGAVVDAAAKIAGDSTSKIAEAEDVPKEDTKE